MIGLHIDVKGLVVWFSIRPVSACAKVQGNVKEVCLYKVVINSDFKLMVLKKLCHFFPHSFGVWARSVTKDSKVNAI